MKEYDKLVKALRDTEIYCLSCPQHVETPDDILCKWGGAERCLFTDAADAIEALQAEIRESMQRCEECGDELAHQMPKRGKWVKGTDGLYHCSKCGKTAPYLDAFDGVIQYWEPLFFCNNCGADMRAKMEVQE